MPLERIASKIFWIRGKKVMLDRDLAELYGVEIRVLNQAVKRNKERFPEDFMFQLTNEEVGGLRSQFVTLDETMASRFDENESLKSQIVTSKRGRHRKYLPYVFTEQGVAMLSSVLKSKKSIEVNIYIIRSFVRLREMLATHKELSEKIEKMERKSDRQFKLVFDVMQRLLDDGKKPKKLIGFE
ncbi:MAG: ORF6N domain-containing protein [Candidatus Moranbacteria bacterium]|nr:ORF6N domain-containing protein [Candidatus Moranbacteria bacterium]